MKRSRLVLAALLAALVLSTIGCDQATKHVARTHLRGAAPITLLGGSVQILLRENTGAFLSLGASLSPRLRSAAFLVGVGGLLLVGALYLVVAFSRTVRGQATSLPLVALASAWLAWAGGFSNLVDRLLFDGRVTDFVILAAGPLHTGVFNVADVAIVAGAAGIALTALRPGHAT